MEFLAYCRCFIDIATQETPTGIVTLLVPSSPLTRLTPDQRANIDTYNPSHIRLQRQQLAGVKIVSIQDEFDENRLIEHGRLFRAEDAELDTMLNTFIQAGQTMTEIHACGFFLSKQGAVDYRILSPVDNVTDITQYSISPNINAILQYAPQTGLMSHVWIRGVMNEFTSYQYNKETNALQTYRQLIEFSNAIPSIKKVNKLLKEKIKKIPHLYESRTQADYREWTKQLFMRTNHQNKLIGYVRCWLSAAGHQDGIATLDLSSIHVQVMSQRRHLPRQSNANLARYRSPLNASISVLELQCLCCCNNNAMEGRIFIRDASDASVSSLLVQRGRPLFTKKIHVFDFFLSMQAAMNYFQPMPNALMSFPYMTWRPERFFFAHDEFGMPARIAIQSKDCSHYMLQEFNAENNYSVEVDLEGDQDLIRAVHHKLGSMYEIFK